MGRCAVLLRGVDVGGSTDALQPGNRSRAARLFSSKAFPVVAWSRNGRTVLALHDLVST